MDKINHYYSTILQVSIFCLGGILFWFAFVYYPGIVTDVKIGKTFPVRTVFKAAVATSHTFPIETAFYRIEYDKGANIYFVYISGENLLDYVFNLDNAKLTLKSALSIDNLCLVNVVYTSSEGLDVPEQYKGITDC